MQTVLNMYKITFDIGSYTEPIEIPPVLVLEVSDNALNYMIMQADKSLQKLRYYQVDVNNTTELAETLEDIFANDDLLGKPFSHCNIVYNFATSQLIPEKYYCENINRQLLDVIHGDFIKGVVLNEKISDAATHNIYSIPKALHEVLMRKYPKSLQYHCYTLLLNHLYKHSATETDKVVVSFYRKSIIATVIKNNRLQLMQQITYQTTEDIAYWLLNIYRQFNLEQLSTSLIISGMIDEDSAIYSQLQKYFAKIDFEPHPDYIKDSALLNGYPKHFFSPILKLATCVS